MCNQLFISDLQLKFVIKYFQVIYKFLYFIESDRDRPGGGEARTWGHAAQADGPRQPEEHRQSKDPSSPGNRLISFWKLLKGSS